MVDYTRVTMGLLRANGVLPTSRVLESRVSGFVVPQPSARAGSLWPGLRQ